jgi:RimJ/RimL family protein N-acetyltransferase
LLAVKLPYTFPSPLVTERLSLRFLTPADVDDVHAYQSREDVCRYLPYTVRDRETVTEKVAQFAQARTLSAEHDFWQLALDRDGRVIGDLYFTIASVAHQTGEIGWSMHPDHHGRGYMTEAAGAVLQLAFTEIGLHRVMARLDARNDGSAALCRRLGMRQEAHFLQDDWCKGEWTDTLVFGLLAAEAIQH